MKSSTRWWPTLLGVMLLLAIGAVAVVAVALQLFSPQTGEWSLTVRLWPLSSKRQLSVPALIRVATHPLGMSLLDGRSTATALGRWTWRREGAERLVGVCAPCRLHLAALGPAPLTVPHARLELKREAQSRFRGTLFIGEAERALAFRWRATLSASALTIDAHLPTVSIADAYAAFGPTAVPELGAARIGGTFSTSLRLVLPERRLELAPKLEGFEVTGLRTEALLHAARPSQCEVGASGASSTARIGGWLPRAVVAAEDQRFQEHAGYDLVQMLAAAALNHHPGHGPSGASTLTQQLAKWLYVGDERSFTRKLRELLYAVEMERTLGKGRILQLYLAMAPWGEGVCGAEAAAQHYLRKSSALLTSLEAAWLASLLRGGINGERRVDVPRVGWVLASLRGPLSPERRAEQLQALDGWAPPVARASRSPAARR